MKKANPRLNNRKALQRITELREGNRSQLALLEQPTTIKVIGVGGGGMNVVDYMVKSNIEMVDYIAINTDKQSLLRSNAPTKILIGEELTNGLGASANPETGYQAAKNDINEIENALRGADMVFVTLGLGGGTGTGASLAIAQSAKKMGILTVVLGTMPFAWEGKERKKLALKGLKDLKEVADSVILIENDNLVDHVKKQNRSFTLSNSFEELDRALAEAIIINRDLIRFPGLINLDFEDVRYVLKTGGIGSNASVGMGVATTEEYGKERSRIATRDALANPLLSVNPKEAKGLIFNVAGNSEDFTYDDLDFASEVVAQNVSPKANIIVGSTLREDIQKGTIHVSVLVVE